ncbi:hypothetical protein HDU92_006322, partial [Lobulomyces angularis]
MSNCRVWFQLVDTEGNPYNKTSLANVLVQQDTPIYDLKRLIKVELSNTLLHIDAGQLEIYESVDNLEKDPIALDAPVTGLGNTLATKLFVVVPSDAKRPPGKKSKLVVEKEELTTEKSPNTIEKIKKDLVNLVVTEQMHDQQTNKKQTIFKLDDSQDKKIVDGKSIVKIDTPFYEGQPNLLLSDNFFHILDEKIELPYKKINKYNFRTKVLIGASGCGKTASCYHVCRTRFALYFDCLASSNMKSLLQKIADIVPTKRSEETQRKFEYKTEHCISCLLLSRILVLDYLLVKDPLLSSLDWLKYQLSSKTEATFDIIFNQLIKIDEGKVSSSLDRRLIMEDQLIIFDECQCLLEELKNDFRSKAEGVHIKNNKLEHPRSFFSFLTRHTLKYRTIWCGTHMSIRRMEEFCSCAGGKPSQISKECLVSDIEISLEQELCHFLQGKPSSFTSFLTRVMLNKEHKKNSDEGIRDVFEIYRNLMTSAEKKDEIGSICKGVEILRTAKLTSDILLNVCLQSLFSKSNYLEFYPHEGDMVSTGLVMIEKVESSYRCYMGEPMTLLAGLNCFNTNTHRDAMMEYFYNLIFSEYRGALNPPPQPRGLLMELVVALQFLRVIYQKKCFDIQRPVGVINCRNAKMDNENEFFTNLQKPGESKYLTLPSSGGPNISYSYFQCGVKKTSTVDSTISERMNEEWEKNLDSLNPKACYEHWPPSKRTCEEILKEINDEFVLFVLTYRLLLLWLGKNL